MKPHPFTQEGLASLLRRLAPPSVMGALLMAMHALVDAAFIGYFLGEEALAGLSLGMPLSVIVGACTGWVGGGAASVWSRQLGSSGRPSRYLLMSQVLWLCLGLSLALGLAGLFGVRAFLGMMGGEGKALAAGALFYAISLGGSFFGIYGVSMNGLLRSEGLMTRAMSLAFLSIAINVGLDALFLGLLGMGIGASAWSTVLSTAVLSMGAHIIFMRCETRELRNAQKEWRVWLKLDVAMSKNILASGSPSLVNQSSVLLRQTLLFYAIGRYGEEKDIALLGTAFRIFHFAILPVFGLMQSLQPVAGILHGAGERRRVLHALGLWTAAGFLLLLPAWLTLQLFPRIFLALFFPGAMLADVAVTQFRLALSGLPLLVFPIALLTCWQSVGQHQWANALSMLRQWVLFPFLLVVFVYWKHVFGIYLALAIESLLFASIALVSFVAFRREYAKQHAKA